MLAISQWEQKYVYTTFSLLIYLPVDTGQFFYLGFCIEYGNRYEIVGIFWALSFYLLCT